MSYWHIIFWITGLVILMTGIILYSSGVKLRRIAMGLNIAGVAVIIITGSVFMFQMPGNTNKPGIFNKQIKDGNSDELKNYFEENARKLALTQYNDIRRICDSSHDVSLSMLRDAKYRLITLHNQKDELTGYDKTLEILKSRIAELEEPKAGMQTAVLRTGNSDGDAKVSSSPSKTSSSSGGTKEGDYIAISDAKLNALKAGYESARQDYTMATNRKTSGDKAEALKLVTKALGFLEKSDTKKYKEFLIGYEMSLADARCLNFEIRNGYHCPDSYYKSATKVPDKERLEKVTKLAEEFGADPKQLKGVEAVGDVEKILAGEKGDGSNLPKYADPSENKDVPEKLIVWISDIDDDYHSSDTCIHFKRGHAPHTITAGDARVGGYEQCAFCLGTYYMQNKK